MKRVKLDSSDKTTGSIYFDAASPLMFLPTGCKLLDCVLGGGWAFGRIANIVGGNSTGKTLLAIEACANFARKFEKGKIRYREVEAAFDKPYAASLGLPLDRVDMPDDECETVEDFERDLVDFMNKLPKGQPGLYILDSLDALSDKDEMEAEIDKSSYGAKKAKQMSRLFRKINQRLSRQHVCVILISQVRDKIGVSFGNPHSRSGGKALDFYATHVVYLHQIGRIKKTKHGIERKIGVNVRVKCEKNKVSNPFRECDFPILFGYGVDDVTASVQWLQEIKKLDEIGVKVKDVQKTLKLIDRAEPDEYKRWCKKIKKAVSKCWKAIDRDFLPKRKKYE